MQKTQSIKWLARIVCLGIALDNGINTFYYLNIENWSNFSIFLITISSIVLNGLLYHHGSELALKETIQELLQPKVTIIDIFPYIISIGSAIVMSVFTLHSYLTSTIKTPLFFIYLFTLCYFIGTHTLIIQASKISIKQKFLKLSLKQKIVFCIWLFVFMAATASAVNQWSLGILWLTNNNFLFLLLASITYIGEIFFVSSLIFWLINQKTLKHKLFLLISIASILNAVGFACMTEYDSWVTQLLSHEITFILGFMLSFFMMLKSLVEWLKNLELSKQTSLQRHRQA